MIVSFNYTSDQTSFRRGVSRTALTTNMDYDATDIADAYDLVAVMGLRF